MGAFTYLQKFTITKSNNGFTQEKILEILSSMGKSKKRILHKTNSSIFMTRETAISKVFGILSKHPNSEKIEAHNLITLFGLDAEELSEAGVDYENLKSLDLLARTSTW